MKEGYGSLDDRPDCTTHKEATNEIVRLDFIGGNVTDIAMPMSSEKIQSSCFAFSLHKAGSSLLNSMLHAYSRRLGLSFLDLPSIVAKNGDDISNMTEESGDRILRSRGYGYWGWRNYARCLNRFDFSTTRNILLVRDPRDRLVSQFFSFGRSHTIPEGGRSRAIVLAARQEAMSMTINEYATSKVEWIDQNWRLYHNRLTPLTTRIYRYEDIVFRKEAWLADIIHFFCFPYDELAVQEIASAHDVRPDKENPDAHIRQVTPGNFRAHLSAATIDYLNRELGVYLEAYGYLEPENYGEKLVFASEGDEASVLFDAFR